MEKYAIIVAGGEGTRIGGDLPKQFREVAGKPMLWWSIKRFHEEDPSTNIRLVLHPGFFDDWKKMFYDLPEEDRIIHEVVAGGKSRTESVKNGLNGILLREDSLVAIHDAARPLVTVDLIRRGWKAAEEAGGAVPVVPVTDSLRKKSGEGSKAIDRSGFVAVQTPQVFRTSLLVKAYSENPDAVYSDDATAFEAYGMEVAMFDGYPQNMKVTNPGDLEIATLLIRMNGES